MLSVREVYLSTYGPGWTIYLAICFERLTSAYNSMYIVLRCFTGGLKIQFEPLNIFKSQVKLAVI